MRLTIVGGALHCISKLTLSPHNVYPSYMQTIFTPSNIPKCVNSIDINFKFKISFKYHHLQSPTFLHLNKSGEGEALGIIHSETQFLSMLKSVKHKNQVICSQYTMVGQAQQTGIDVSVQREKREGKRVRVPRNFKMQLRHQHQFSRWEQSSIAFSLAFCAYDSFL